MKCKLEPAGVGKIRCPACNRTLPAAVGLDAVRECVPYVPATPKPACRFLGSVPIGRVACAGCKPGTFLKTFACGSPDVAQAEAVRAKQTLPDSVANCLDCGYYEAPTAGG